MYGPVYLQMGISTGPNQIVEWNGLNGSKVNENVYIIMWKVKKKKCDYIPQDNVVFDSYIWHTHHKQ